jgi:hypothetical protein
LEIAEDLSLEEDFWKPESSIRSRWLSEYNRLCPGNLDGFKLSTLTGLHVAAAMGFMQLVASLIKNGHAEEIHQRHSLVNTPVSASANFSVRIIRLMTLSYIWQHTLAESILLKSC